MNEQQLKSVFQERLEDLVFEKKQSAKLTQNQIADGIGIATSALSNYLNSDREAGAIALYKIAKYFGVTADYLLGLENAPNHIGADVCRETGLSAAAVNELRLCAWFAKIEQRDLGRAAENGLFIETLSHLIVDCPGVISDLAIYLFTDVDKAPEISFSRNNHTVGISDDKKFIFAGVLTVINEQLAKERERLHGVQNSDGDMRSKNSERKNPRKD